MTGIGNINMNNIINQMKIQSEKNSTDNIKKKAHNAYNFKDDKELKKVCQEFESVFVHMLLKQMRKTITEGGLIEKSNAREIFEDMYDQEIAKKISSNGDGIGLANILYKQLSKNIK